MGGGVALLVLLLLAGDAPADPSTAAAGRGVEQAESIVVTAARLPLPLEATGRSVAVLTADEIARQPVRSLPELLQLLPGLDVARRGVFGVQADLSARGSSFEDVLVLVDGVPVNDPQTGHHSLDLPLPIGEIDRIELLLGPGSALYGGNASGAVVQIVSRQASEDGATATLLAGEHRLAGGSASWGGGSRRLGRHRVSVERSESDGFRPGTEFEQSALWYRGSSGRLTWTAAASARDFGAYRFYSDRFPDEYEETDTRLAALAWRGEVGSGELSARASAREHLDLFVLDRNRPAFASNRHRARTAEGEVSWRTARSWGDLELGVGGREERLASSNLGDRSRSRTGGFASWAREARGGAWRAALFVDSVDGESELHPSLAWGRALGAGRLRLAVASAYRLPSFTELSYRDPATAGNPDLAPERSWTGELGYDLSATRWRASASGFVRRGRDLIDFVRAPGDAQFRAQNVREVETRGVELAMATTQRGVAVHLSYAGLSASGEAPAGSSRYVFDYLRHRALLRLSGEGPWHLRWGGSLTWAERRGQASYARLDLRLARPLPAGLELFVEGSNLGEAEYRERGGLEMPGRWLLAGVTWRQP